jgi:hypothetical protein
MDGACAYWVVFRINDVIIIIYSMLHGTVEERFELRDRSVYPTQPPSHTHHPDEVDI